MADVAQLYIFYSVKTIKNLTNSYAVVVYFIRDNIVYELLLIFPGEPKKNIVNLLAIVLYFYGFKSSTGNKINFEGRKNIAQLILWGIWTQVTG